MGKKLLKSMYNQNLPQGKCKYKKKLNKSTNRFHKSKLTEALETKFVNICLPHRYTLTHRLTKLTLKVRVT